ncbi:zinc finger protein 22-like isoform X2 [Hyperolius riggenbachi]|uniref:zinc finger protein 22-like isoform X2 n=1 Tax=Hyperolius riggenbachi TaxID=752182 RepID=UPI0035A3C1CD
MAQGGFLGARRETMPGEGHADDSTETRTLPPEQESEAAEVMETESREIPLKDPTTYNSQTGSNIGNASSVADDTESTDFNPFFSNSSDMLQFHTEPDANSELEALCHPSAYNHTERRGMDDKPYGCKYCIRRFAHSSSLYRHQKSHITTELYKCKQCEKAFTSPSNLNLHSRIHAGMKPYECSDCGKRFTRKFGLHQHVKSHSQEKLYICSHCGKSYADYFFLLKHQQMERASVPYP